MSDAQRRPGTSSTLRRRVETDPVLQGLSRELADASGGEVVLVVFGLPGGRVFEVHRGLAPHQRHAHWVIDVQRLVQTEPAGVAMGEGAERSLPYALRELLGLRAGWVFPIGDRELGRIGVTLVGRRKEGADASASLGPLAAVAHEVSERACRILARTAGHWTRPEIPAVDPSFGRAVALLDRLAGGPVPPAEVEAVAAALPEALASVRSLQALVEMPNPAAPHHVVEGVRRSLRAVRAFGAIARPFVDGDRTPWALALLEKARVKMLGQDPELRLLAGRLRTLGLVAVSPR